ncbi:S-adenosylmethionine decarboxylase [Linnemannia elongata AG-77]|uniref:S-adenosylmethionine decarboxylase n=1 Tax=Linnemannia elongata AG-77 TaxID=1314771 RepID=A0A197K9M3_9FUNG|nr:S-adenosylmethionine decarboxylase [Linnemannia elongata AG-77]
MAVPTTVPIPSAATIAATSANIHDLKAALAASTLTVHDGGEMSDNKDITPSTAAVHIPWSSDSFLDTSDDQPMEPGSFEGPEKLLEIHFAPHMQDVQHIRTPLNNNNPFTSVEGEEERYGLRIIPKAVWEEMLDIVQCKVLHSIHHPTVDAYVLSESSFFVFPHKLILKTCGTTTLLMALPKILEFAQDWCGLLHSPSSSGAEMKEEEEDQQQQQPYRVFYSRKKFLFPEKQVHVHREWKDEVEFLDRHFNSGSAYTIGKVNGDHWCLYVTAPFLGYPCNSNKEVKGDETAMENLLEEDDATQGGLFGFPPTRPLSRASSSRSSSASTTDDSESEDTPTTTTTQGADGEDYDQTIEILMTDLNPKAMQKFYHHANKNQPSGSEGGEVVDQQTGLATLFPEAEIDSFLFTPCGYSANALLKQSSSTGAGAGKYFTIHVTPEPVCSYASFETNIPVRLSSSSKTHHLSAKGTAPETVQELIQRVVNIFQPGNLTVTIFASAKPGASQKQIEKRQFKMLHSLRSLPGFRRTDRILYGLDGYDLIYGHYLAV